MTERHASPDLRAALEYARDLLAPCSATPELDSELLLALVLERTRTYLTAFPETPLTAAQWLRFNELLEQRAQHVPVAYLLAHKEFWSRPFRVSSDVLVPRPDTETLIDIVLSRYPAESALRVLELGTGSGILAITLQLERPRWHITATDLSRRALCVARENARTLNASTIEWIVSDWFASLAPRAVFDLILSNPPYLSDCDPHLPELCAEPRQALVAGRDGLDAIRVLTALAPGYLCPNGLFLLEHGYTQGEAVRALFKQAGFMQVATEYDLCGQERVTGGYRSDFL